MEPHFTATGRHLPYGITPATRHENTPLLNSSQTGCYSIYLSWRDGRLSWRRWLTGYIPRWFTRPQTVTHLSTCTYPMVRNRESNSQPLGHESDALTTTPPSHPIAFIILMATIFILLYIILYLYWLVPSGYNCVPVSARHGSSVPGWTVPAHHCVSKSSRWASVRHNQQPGHIPRCRLSTYGTRAFSVAGPVCWNSTGLFEVIWRFF